MPDDESTSLAQEMFRGQLDIFERELERFLTSSSTPVDARRAEAGRVMERLLAIVERLRAQGVL